MPGIEIVAWLRTQGYGDLARILHGRMRGALEADDEAGVIAAFLGGPIPFDAEADRRE